ncbi:MAG: AMP-binding protein [Ilumatobacter sp.]|uniref:class I adenylate-forming enzyme family protein n=1 Tax=Ilumatobacter sp. TaxID=1967498 RepID=UPI003298E028
MTEPTTLAAMTFAAMWDASVRSRGNEVFLRFEASDATVHEWTYDEFDRVVAHTAGRLTDAGVDAERGVHLALTNSPSFVAAWLAAIRLGSWIVPSDPMATAPELAEHLRRTRPAVSVVAMSRQGVSAEASATAGDDVRDLVTIPVDEDDVTLDALTTNEGRPSVPVVIPPAIDPTDRAAVMFTSGTTGRPKGVVVTQANYAFAGTTMAAAADLGPNDRQLVVLPMFHANAQYYSFASAIAVGASVPLMHTFSASRFVAQAARHGATHASLFAGPLRMILARGGPWTPEGTEPPLALRHCWFAQNITNDQYETLTDWFGCRPRQLYGMTETIPAVLTDEPVAPRPSSMGFVTTGCTVALQDADGAPTPVGEVGEIVVGGTPGHTLFAGYLDDPDTTAASFRDGWFVTGDRARVDADGRFSFDGRRSDVLKVSGENVSVVEVEAVIGEHPDVFDVVVVGAPDPIRDEVPVAYVVAAPGAGDTLVDDLGEWCAERLAKAKRPRRVILVDELPRTSVGKVRKFLLTEAASRSDGDTPHSKPGVDPVDTNTDPDSLQPSAHPEENRT